jgi:proteasome lid subunit RPN8/RPN11
MLRALVRGARQVLGDLHRAWRGERNGRPQPRPAEFPASPPVYEPLRRVVLTDGVGHTLFEEFAAHRAAERGEEETGWLLLGLRRQDEAVVLATLPAGAEADASVSHVRFNSAGQALGSRIVRQADRRLNIVGVVHTHPGSLRHPSDADYRGDVHWVRALRGGEGVFGIGTADRPCLETLVAEQPRPHVQCLGELTFSWYALAAGDARYRPLPVEFTLGPDLARPLHNVWPAVEAHAERLERLVRQQARVAFEVITEGKEPELVLNIPLAEPDSALRILLTAKRVRYLLRRGDELLAADCADERVDRGVYLLLAELAAQD